jgi:hypothetical protein
MLAVPICAVIPFVWKLRQSEEAAASASAAR